MPTPRIALTALLTSLALAGLASAGCSSAESGTPRAGDPPSSEQSGEQPGEQPGEQETTSAEPAPTGDTPSVDRPKVVDLSTVDLCAVVSGLPLPEYELDTDRPPLAGESSLFPGEKDCFVNGIRSNVSLLVVAARGNNAAEYAEFASVKSKSETTAAGFPLIVLTPQAPGSCMGVLDVNDDQMLYLSYSMANPTGQPVTPQERLCSTVPAIATAVAGAL